MLDAAARDERFDTVIMDPPRAGSTPEFLSSVVRLAPERVVYVSCEPSTLARDILRFAERGYILREAAAFDLFPRTKHVETVVLMSRVEK
jgi:23S rRNA (uracil1939-C5)-methyltransferase